MTMENIEQLSGAIMTKRSAVVAAVLLAGSGAAGFAQDAYQLSPYDGAEVVQVGDMLLEPRQAVLTDAPPRSGKGVNGHAALVRPFTRRWPDGRLPVEFDEDIDENLQQRFFAACREWEVRADVKCVTRTNEDVYVHVIKGDGCNSRIGYGLNIFRGNGARTMSLAGGCWFHSTIIHELGHAFGFMHEHMRADRNNYITVLWDNIEPANRGQYYWIPGYTLGTPYDFKSVMHYWNGEFAENGGDTFLGKPGYEEAAAQAGGDVPSESDALGLQHLYGMPQETEPLGASNNVSEGAGRVAKGRKRGPIFE